MWRAPSARAWDADDVALCASANAIIRVLLEQECLQHEMSLQARSDPLTGLLNRRSFISEVDRRAERLEREGLPGTLLFVDLDNFKKLNDAVGHEAGDEALRRVAELLRATVRPTDLVTRLGGDEFAVWMDGADELTGAERAEMLRMDGPRRFVDLLPATPDAPEAPTMSIGIATRWPGRGETTEGLLQRADRGMYRAKRSGRGKWCVEKDAAP
jgi:diguanylate cyclase (GGDEF)-like protein